jgi:predicted HicB family RNase H-like nuclease
MSGRRSYGRTRDGRIIDDAMLAEMADEAERGYTVEELANAPRGRGRPPIGSAAATVESVRLDPELKRDLLLRAAKEQVSVSELIRRVLREYVSTPQRGRLKG